MNEPAHNLMKQFKKNLLLSPSEQLSVKYILQRFQYLIMMIFSKMSDTTLGVSCMKWVNFINILLKNWVLYQLLVPSNWWLSVINVLVFHWGMSSWLAIEGSDSKLLLNIMGRQLNPARDKSILVLAVVARSGVIIIIIQIIKGCGIVGWNYLG